jgi:rubredoxin-NAD+ reductase
MHPIIIIGAGMAAYSLAREFRKLDKSTPLMIVTADAGASYAKPMLSNALALGKDAQQLMSNSAAQMALQLGIEIKPATRVTGIDGASNTIRTDAGPIVYDKLVLAIGADAIRLNLAGDGADRVLSVNHIDDYAALRAQLADFPGGARVTILGAGLIGCEFAEDLSGAGHSITLVDPNLRPLAALAAPALSAGLMAAWATRTIALELGTSAASVDQATTTGTALQVTLANGKTIEADIVLSAVGLRPAVALAKSANLATGRGILVDAFGRSSDEAIFALGDCAEYATAGGSAVLPYVAPLLTAARAIASTLAGKPTTIDLKTDAVIVKTPSYKLALVPPPAGAAGNWIDQVEAGQTISRFVDVDDMLRGFGVSQHTPALRQALLAALHQKHTPAQQ